MRTRAVVFGLVFVIALAMGGYYLARAAASDAAIEQIIRQAADAYNKKDLSTLERICDPNIVVLEEGRKNVGWADLRDNHLKTEWESMTEFYWDVGQIQVHTVGKDFGWATSEGTFKGKAKDGTDVKQTAMLTWIIQRKGGAWKILHHHGSGVPVQK